MRPTQLFNKAVSGTGCSVNNNIQHAITERWEGENTRGNPPSNLNGDLNDGEKMPYPEPYEIAEFDIPEDPFAPPEVDEHTRRLYLFGLLGGGNSPFQIGIAYSPRKFELEWAIFAGMCQIYNDAFNEFFNSTREFDLELDLAAGTGAVTFEALDDFKNSWSAFLQMMKQVTTELFLMSLPLGIQITGLPIGTAAIPVKRPLRLVSSGISHEEAAAAAQEAKERADQQDAKKAAAKEEMAKAQGEYMSHSLKERAGYWWSAIKEVFSGSAAAKIAGAVAGTAAFVGVVATGGGLLLALAAAGTAALISSLVVGAVDAVIGSYFCGRTFWSSPIANNPWVEAAGIIRNFWIIAGAIAEGIIATSQLAFAAALISRGAIRYSYKGAKYFFMPGEGLYVFESHWLDIFKRGSMPLLGNKNFGWNLPRAKYWEHIWHHVHLHTEINWKMFLNVNNAKTWENIRLWWHRYPHSTWVFIT